MFKDLGKVRIAYDIVGSGEPLILLGGFGANRRFWNNAIPLLEGFTVVTMDARGVGETVYSGKFTMDDLADDAVSLMDALGFKRFYAIGWSMGTAVLQSLSARYSDRVIAQAMVSTYSRCPARSSYILSEFTRMVNDGSASIESFCIVVNAFCFTEGAFRKFQTEGRPVPVPKNPERPEGLSDQISATLAFNPESYLGRIVTPTFIVQGTEDIMTPFDNGESVRYSIAGSELFPVVGEGHTIPPAAYIDKVLEFFRKSAHTNQ